MKTTSFDKKNNSESPAKKEQKPAELSFNRLKTPVLKWLATEIKLYDK